MKKWLNFRVLAGGLLLLGGLRFAWGLDATTLPATLPATSTAPATQTALTPEEVVRHMFLAILRSDGKALAECIVPNDESAILLEPAINMSPEALASMEAQIIKAVMRRVKVGETIPIPTRKGPVQLKFTEDMINEDIQPIIPEGSSLPITVVRVNGQWRADAGTVIAGRKIARAYRTKPATTQPVATRPAAN